MERLILDTDPGVDDAQAILMASAHPNVTIEALFAVGGNVGLEHTLRNSLTLCEVCGMDVPVYAGSDQPLVMFQENAAFAHGEDGLGGAARDVVKSAETEHAALALIRMVNAEPGEFTLAAIGPLTNVALALKFDPDLPKKLKRFVIMGGAVTGDGNTSCLKAEFNIYYDPEAAHIVFSAWEQAGLMIEVVDWEITKRYHMPIEMVQRWRDIDSDRARFFRQITDASMGRTMKLGRPGMFAADPLALAVVLEPDIVTRREHHHLVLELNGAHTRGMTVVDWNDNSGLSANADIIMEVNHERFLALMEQGLQ